MTPFDPITFLDANNLVERIQSTMANLNSAFAAAAGPAAQGPSRLPGQPEEVQEDGNHEPTEIPSHPSHDLGRNPRNASPRGHRQQSPPPQENCDLHGHLNGRRGEQRKQEDANHQQRRSPYRQRNNDGSRGHRPSGDQN